MRKSVLRFAVLCSPLLLAGCGEGWEMQRTDTMFPYGNQRTAGSGVVYVLAKMMPQKDLNIAPVLETSEDAPVPALNANDIFEEEQIKGASNMAVPPTQSVAQVDTPPVSIDVADVGSDMVPVPVAPVEEIVIEAVVAHNAPLVHEQAVAIAEHVDVAVHDVEVLAPMENIKSASAESYISNAPKMIEVPEVEIVDARDLPKGAGHDYSAVEPSSHVQEDVMEDAVTSHAPKEIISPKTDFYAYQSVGQEALDEIYGGSLEEEY